MPRVSRREINCEYQRYTTHVPVEPKKLYAAACENDGPTINSWRNTWINNAKANLEKFGSFKENSVSQLYRKNQHQSAVIIGSGPSLKYNGSLLKDQELPIISCLHNYHFLEDNGVKPDYYVSLDAGDIVIGEVYEGGAKTPEEYWESTKDHTLVCYIGTSPLLLEKWQGKVLFFTCPLPDKALDDEMNGLDSFGAYFSTGGNVLGACLYLAKAVLGCNPIAFVGADFCFSYDNKFHGWDSKYDSSLGVVIEDTDVFGNRVQTWQSYQNFKKFFEWVSLTVPGIYVNCTEGGTFGSYKEGNLMSILQMDLELYLKMSNINANVADVFSGTDDVKKILF